MLDGRIHVQLIPGKEVNETLLATLNRFHFKTVCLSAKTDSPYVLEYASKGSSPRKDVVLLPATDDGAALEHILASNMKAGKRVLKRDYLKEISHHFDFYLGRDGRLANKKISENWQREPSTDVLAGQFEAELVELFGLKAQAAEPRFAVAMTHDVDYLGNYPVGNLKSGLVFLANALRTVKDKQASGFYLKTALRFLSGRVNYYGFDLILNIARRHGFKPTFFLFSGLPGGNGLGLWDRLLELNPNYPIDHPDLVRALGAIRQAGAEAGLHGSYNSPDNGTLLKEEKENLERATGRACAGIRQHYLKFHSSKSTGIYNRVGLRFESNCGFVFENGFLCGTTRPFYSALPGNGQGPVITVPMVFMDAVPLYFRPASVEDVFEKLKETIARIRQFNGFAALNFHQRMISCVPEYRWLYENIAAEINRMRGGIFRLSDVDSFYPDLSCAGNAN